MSSRRVFRLAGKAALACGLFLVLVEVLLRLGTFFVYDPSAKGWRPDASIRILAVGDSHTYGGTVPKGQEYPAQLQRFLDEAAPGVYSVLNVGIPGMNTSQVRNRLPLHLARWNPDLVLLWCGVNNTYNQLERANPSPLQRLDAFAWRARVYRLARVWVHDWTLVGEVEREISGGRMALPASIRDARPERNAEFLIDPEIVAWAEADYTAIVQLVRARGLPIVLITYPLNTGIFEVPNYAMWRASRSLDVPRVDTTAALERVQPAEERLSWAAHPSGRGYGEIARDVAALVLSLDL